MRKDFSDTAKETLIKLVKEVEDEQWSTFTDWLGDLLFLYDWDIADYVNDVDNYWKHTIDNENYTAADIERIFAAADAVDAEHGVALQAQIDAVNAQIEYVKSISAAISTPGGMSPSGLQTIVDKTYALIDATVAAYIETLRDQVGVDADGNPIYQYEYDYIRTLMLFDPKDLTCEQYLALIAVFEEMDIESKELFIEASYIYYDTPDTYAFTDGYRVYNWELSPVFQTMAEISKTELANAGITRDDLCNIDNPDYMLMNNKVFSSMLLMNIALYGKNCIVVEPDGSILMYSQGPFPNIEIVETYTEGVDKKPYDYSVLGGGFSFDLYQFRSYIDPLLDETVVKDNISRLAPSLGETILDCAGTVVETAIGFVPRYGNAFGVVGGVVDISSTINDYVVENQVADYTYGAIDEGNAAAALFMGGSLTVSRDGNVTGYSISYPIYDTKTLAVAFEVYEERTGKQLTVESLLDGTASQSDVDAYVSWYASGGDYLVNQALWGLGED
ncbi:MAG: hypothetical protein LBG68_03515 [Coriobacteriales bacterium]|jgi:hypothetical protein|nr:hypothetical protein [Coriobacteriales bacterium]